MCNQYQVASGPVVMFVLFMLPILFMLYWIGTNHVGCEVGAYNSLTEVALCDAESDDDDDDGSPQSVLASLHRSVTRRQYLRPRSIEWD